MTPKPRIQRLDARLDHANRRVFLSWMDAVTSGTLTLTSAQAIEIGKVGAALKTVEDELGCACCHQPFDDSDKRFAGRAQHSAGPWCRRCVDNCHSSEDPGHRCPVRTAPTTTGI